MKTIEHAYAKANLRLGVTGRDSAGYHLLEMLNVELEAADVLEFEFLSGSAAECNPTCSLQLDTDVYGALTGVAPQENLIVKAHRLVERCVGSALPVQVKLRKQLPAGAGLGAGSSDAAAMVRACCRAVLTRAGYEVSPNARFSELSRGMIELVGEPRWRQFMGDLGALGADITYSLCGGLCEVSGRGELLTPVSSDIAVHTLHGRECVVVVPDLRCPTPEVFARFAGMKLAGEGEYSATGEVTRSVQRLEAGEVAQCFSNDLTRAAVEVAPELARMESWVQSAPDSLCGGMTGSGSTFIVCPSGVPEFSPEHRAELSQWEQSEKISLLFTRMLAIR